MSELLIEGDSAFFLPVLDENSIDSMVTDPPAGINFMEVDFDSDRGGRDKWIAWLSGIMKHALRTLKPGAHALVWSLPRTSHWTATALENAGFEIRNAIAHLFSYSMPKSVDVSKLIDKKIGSERKVIGKRTDAAKLNKKVQTAPGGWVTCNRDPDVTAAGSELSATWQGWGISIKPCFENWILVRKPLDGTIAENVLKWGVGGLNIDACRIPTTDNLNGGAYSKNKNDDNTWGSLHSYVGTEYVQPSGRFPANVVLTKPVDGLLGENAKYFACLEPDPFIYQQKPSRKEKGEGNDHPTVKSVPLMEYFVKLLTPPGGTCLDPFMGTGSTGVACKNLGFKFIGVELDDHYMTIARKRITSSRELS